MLLARWSHLFPFRTEKLSTSAPMVMQPQGCVRVGQRLDFVLNFYLIRDFTFRPELNISAPTCPSEAHTVITERSSFYSKCVGGWQCPDITSGRNGTFITSGCKSRAPYMTLLTITLRSRFDRKELYWGRPLPACPANNVLS